VLQLVANPLGLSAQTVVMYGPTGMFRASGCRIVYSRFISGAHRRLMAGREDGWRRGEQNMLRGLLLIGCLATGLQAANIDVDFTGIQGTQLGGTLEEILVVPTGEGMLPDQPLLCCNRILVTWEGTEMAPIVRFRGVPSEERMQLLEASGARPTATPWGVGYQLPALKGYLAVAIGRDEVMAVAPAVLTDLTEAPAWPEEFTDIMAFRGAATDLNLGDLKEELVDIDFRWPHTGKLTLNSNAHSSGDAKAVLRYIAIRKPLVQAAAGLGIDKADFPSRLLSATSWDRDGKLIKATLDLDEKTKIEAVDYLTKSLRRHLRHYR
jgi:hypothetical protein